MGKSPKGGGGGQTYQPQASYGGQTMTQADADAKYKADMAAWRAPTSTGTTPMAQQGMTPADINGVPQLPTLYMGDASAGPAIPAMGVLPTAPVAVQRNSLASLMQPTGYGTAWSPFSPNSNSGGGYQMRPGPTFSSLSRGGR